MTAFSTSDIVRNLVLATRWTLLLSAIALFGGAVLGMALLPMHLSKHKILRKCVGGLTTVVQGTPLLIQLFLMFFGLAAIGFNIGAWLVAVLTLVLWTGVFLGDIWKGCVLSIRTGQWEASSSLAMTWIQQMRYVILPQAVQIALPATVGFSVQVIKNTALTSIIGFVELTRTASFVSNATYRPLITYAIVGAIYFLICWPLSLAANHIGNKYHVAH